MMHSNYFPLRIIGYLRVKDVGVFSFAFMVLGMCFWMDFLGIDRNAHVLALTCSSLVASILLSGIAIRHRRDLAMMLFGYRPEFA